MRLHLVDGTFELYRAHYSGRPDREAIVGGRRMSVKATLGLAHSMLALIAEEKATHLAIAFDNPIVSFRNRLFDGYKTDVGVPEELRAQFDLVEEVARAFGFIVWSMDEFEADDALATAALKFRDQVEHVRICTPDKDLGACVTGKHVVLLDRIRRRVIDEDAVRSLRGVAPAAVPDFLALVGDTADGIPGLRGFGEKTAAALLSRYGRVDDIPDDPARWDVAVRGKERLGAELAARRADVALYRTLATLRTDVPLAESLEDLDLERARARARTTLPPMLERFASAELAGRARERGFI